MFTLQLHSEGGTASVAERLGGRRVQEWRDDNGEVRAYGYAAPGWWAMEWPGWATFTFSAANSVVDVYHQPSVPRARLEDTYRRSVVPLQLQALGYETLHASAVSVDGRTVAFCGERRAGKSTLAFALQRRGFAHRADDTVVLSVSGEVVQTVPLPFTPRLRPQSAHFFGATSPDAIVAADRVEPLGAVVILEQDPALDTSTVERLPGAAAVSALLSHAHCFEPGDPVARRRLVEHYLQISAVVPVHRLRFPPGLNELSRLTDRVLETLDAVEAVAS